VEEVKRKYETIAQSQCVAVFLAKEFNKISPPGCRKVFFLDVALVEPKVENSGSAKFFTSEKLLWDYKKRFSKWNNNAGSIFLT